MKTYIPYDKTRCEIWNRIFHKYIIPTVHCFRLELVSSSPPPHIQFHDKTQLFLLSSSQFLTSLVGVTQFSLFLCLNTILISVACAQFEKLKAAILDIKQQHITPHHVQEDDQVHKIAKCNLQEKLKACIRHHQEIME